VAIPDLEQRSLLLLLVDRQIFEPYSVDQCLLGDASLRERLAFALANVPDARAAATLRGLAEDKDAAVRRAAVFGLGLHAEDVAANRPPLLRAAHDADATVGGLAVEALARLGTHLKDVQDALAPLAPAARDARLVPFLFRFQEDATVPVAVAALASSEASLHDAAAYALARYPRPAAVPELRNLLADAHPFVRGWAARAIGPLGDGSDLTRLRPLLDDAATGPVVQALRAAARIVADGKAAAPADWRPRLLALFADPRVGVRVTALEVAGTWLGDEGLAAALRDRFRTGPLRERQLALDALVAGGDAQAGDLVTQAARATEWPLRASAADGAAKLHLTGLDALAADAEPAVRVAVLGARLGNASAEEGEPIARAALGDSDVEMRSSALDWYAEHPLLPTADLVAAIARGAGDSLSDARKSAIGALRARAMAQPQERDAALSALHKVVAGDDWLLRRAASEALVALGVTAPAIGEAGRGLPIGAYRDLVERSALPHRVQMDTDKGTVVIDLDCEHAALTCTNFLSLAQQGFYDGLLFHRVVPDFVVQGGDPRGDGSGGPGWELPDEINLLRYDRPGVVGMALSGPDTGGSQFYVTLAPQPHLDGGYTAFGTVASGLEVLESLEQWNRILRIREQE
jgi:cyclophilin family peptidyl-prolyl cis-trans isomerase/HEAT repeat protein